ncbi:hypothetical protein GN956_G7128 [Arapaima gigas]
MTWQYPRRRRGRETRTGYSSLHRDQPTMFSLQHGMSGADAFKGDTGKPNVELLTSRRSSSGNTITLDPGKAIGIAR